jgi:hypothetical protein
MERQRREGAWSRGPLLLAACLLLVLPRVSSAQSGGAEAEQLFRDGKRLMKEGAFGEACTAFATSQKLDPSVSTLLNLADCREKNGQIASAWDAFLEVERTTRGHADQTAFHKTASDRAAKLEPRLSYLTVSVPDESRVDGLELTRNDAVIEPGSWNRAIPVDGGDYTITGHAPGHEKWSTTVHVATEHGSITVDVPKFKTVEHLMKKPDAPIERSDVARSQSPFTGRRKAAIGVASAGLLALGAGIVLSVQAKGFEDDGLALCPSNPCGANAGEANALLDKGGQRALFANISYAVTGVAVAAAAVLWFTGAPNRHESATALVPVASPTSAGLAILGRF